MLEHQTANKYNEFYYIYLLPVDFSKKSKFNLDKLLKINNSIHKKRYLRMMKHLKSGKTPFTLPAKSVAKKVYTALIVKNPKTQYFVTFPTYILAYSRILPNPVFEKFIEFVDKQN